MRLTEKANDKICDYDIKKGCLCKAIDKLGQLENIEDELGIDLITLFKILTIGFYYKGISTSGIEYIGFARMKRVDRNYMRVNNKPYYFKDYGKTWSLDKNDLTKE